MPTVAAAVLKVDPNQFGTGGKSRLEEFGITVNQVSSLLKTAAGSGGVRLLVAPEYVFSARAAKANQPTETRPMPMGRDDKHELYSGLEKVSKAAGDLNIVAGTIFYTKGGDAVTGLNVCPVLRNGSIITKHYKRDDDLHTQQGTPGATFDYKDPAPYFKAGGVRFGVEICADHGSLRLKNWLAEKGKTIDVHILISEGARPQMSKVAVDVTPGQIVGNKKTPDTIAAGYVIHCDQSGRGNVGVTGPGGAVKECGLSNPQVNGVITYIYKFDV